MRKSILSRFTEEEQLLALALQPDRWACECGAVPSSTYGRTPCVPAGQSLPARVDDAGAPIVGEHGPLTVGHHTRTAEQAQRSADRRLFDGLVVAADVTDKMARIRAMLADSKEE